MRKKSPYTFYMPTKIIDIIGNLPLINKEDAYILLNHILNIQSLHKDKEFICINKAKFQKKYSINPSKLITVLVKNNVLISDGIFKPKSKSYHYKINDNLIDELKLVYIEPHTKPFSKIDRRYLNNKKNYCTLAPHLRKLQKNLVELKMDNKIVLEIIENSPKINETKRKVLFNLNAANAFQDIRRRNFGRNISNKRLDTNCTNMNRELRNAIIGDFTNIDLANAQPTLLSILLKEIFEENKIEKTIKNLINAYPNDEYIFHMANTICSYFSIPKFTLLLGKKVFTEISKIPINNNFAFFSNLSDFKSTCVSGNFYNKLVDDNNSYYTRNEIKKMMIPVLFSKPRNEKNQVNYYHNKKVFAKSYPLIMEILNIINKKHNSEFAIYLQSIESAIFIDLICYILYLNDITPAFTIHDSIVVETHQANKALKIMKDTIQQTFGVIPQFGIELIGTANYKPAQPASSSNVA